MAANAAIASASPAVATHRESAPRPLDGVRVLDFTHVLAGPFSTRILADLGADVVRVESSKHPDSPWKTSADRGLERPAAYLVTNRGKRSIAVDLKNWSGRDLAVRLATVADVVIENFSAGVMTRLGLSDADLRPHNPRLIYVSMSGYGHDGPRRDWTSMNMNLQGYSGLMMATGAEGDPPTAISNSWNDYIAGLHAAVCVVGSLADRAKTGVGKYCDLSQFECSVATLGALLVSSAVDGVAPPRTGNRSAYAAPQGTYRCAGDDEWCAISVQTDEQWDALVMVMGASTWARGAGLNTLVDRQRHHHEIDRRVEAWTRTLTAEEVERQLRRRGVPARRMRRAQNLVEELDGASVFQRIPDPRRGSLVVTGLPFQGPRAVIADTPAPRLGADTDTVLQDWLGLNAESIDLLAREGVFV